MPQQAKQLAGPDDRLAQRAVIVQLLRDDHAERWSRAEIERELSDIEPLVIGHAIGCLADQEVVQASGESVRASACARHLDALELISI